MYVECVPTMYVDPHIYIYAYVQESLALVKVSKVLVFIYSPLLPSGHKAQVLAKA